jgi:two-component system LytT family response regulator
MINTVIVDDEPLGREMLAGLLKNYCPGINVVAECGTISTAKEAIGEYKPHLVFMDIALPGGNGFDLLKSLGGVDFDVVFVTAHDEYVLKALRFNAVDYLLKPIDETELVQAVSRVQMRQALATEKLNIRHLLEQHMVSGFKKSESLCIPDSKGFQVVKLDEIICCEASNTYTIFHLPGGRQMVSTKPLTDYEELLSDSGFTRIHKSWLINMKHVKEYVRGEGGVVLLTDGHSVDVSRRKKEHFVSELKKVFKF